MLRGSMWARINGAAYGQLTGRCGTAAHPEEIMPVDPGIQAMLDVLESLNRPSITAGTPEAARAGFRLLTVGMRQPHMVIPVRQVEDIVLPGPAGPVAARVYRPDAEGKLPTIAFFHGGGFVIGDIDTHDNQARRLCRDVGAVVVSVDYRRAPEDPWPAGVDDACAATRWLADHIAVFGNDPDRLAVAGDSAGGNFAAVAAQVFRDEGGPKLAAQLLIYPAVDFDETLEKYASRVECAEGYFLTAGEMKWFAEHYRSDPDDVANPRLSPIYGDLTGLPPAVVVTAEFDPMRDEGEAYARAMQAAGVDVELMRFDGLIHGFFDLAVLSEACAAAADATCTEFAKLL